MGAASSDVEKWDPGLTEHVVGLTWPIVKRYFRSQALGLDNIPPGGSLVVSNHSGGMVKLDLSVFATDFYDKFGYGRPLYALGHDLLFTGPAAEFFERTGVIRATRDKTVPAEGHVRSTDRPAPRGAKAEASHFRAPWVLVDQWSEHVPRRALST